MAKQSLESMSYTRAVWGWAGPSAQVKSSTHFINVLEDFREERKWTDLRYMLAVSGTVHRKLASKIKCSEMRGFGWKPGRVDKLHWFESRFESKAFNFQL